MHAAAAAAAGVAAMPSLALTRAMGWLDASTLLPPNPPPGLIERGELKSSLVDVGTVEAVVLQLTRDEEDLDQVGIYRSRRGRR